MSTLLNFNSDIRGATAYAPEAASVIFNAKLVTATESNFDVPATAKIWIAFFSYQDSTNVWVDLSGNTAAVPAGGTFSATTSELNPDRRTVYANDTISCITDTATAEVSVSLYPISYS